MCFQEEGLLYSVVKKSLKQKDYIHALVSDRFISIHGFLIPESLLKWNDNFIVHKEAEL